LEDEFSALQTLIDLGLTLIQARVYLALVESRPTKISAISKMSSVARPDVYRILSKLQQLGIVEKIIRTPFEYRAIPMKKALPLLLGKKTEQYKKIRAKTQMMLATTQTRKTNNPIQIEKTQFVLIPQGKALIGRIRNAHENVQNSIDHVLSWKRFSQGITSMFAESIEIAWAKNVKTRFILESPLENKTAGQLIQFYREKPFCQIRFVARRPKTIFAIYDKKEISIIVNPKADLLGSPTLWSNNPALVSLAKDYFEMLWLSAIEKPFFEAA
jgi:sugar-specific transcriptional regulator TrmB